ncbi:MAG: dihydrodipicolinate synthase family protein, partial [Clostridiales bacterium]
PILKLGGSGIVSVAGHLVGKEIQEMIACFNRGELDQAEQLHQRYLPFFQKMFLCANPIPLKYCLNRVGLPAGPCRLPLCEAESSIQAELDDLLVEYGLL